MLCPHCGYKQESGKFCKKCGSPLPESNNVRSSKTPIILTLAAICGIAFGVGLFFMFFSGNDKIQTQSDSESSTHGGLVTEDSSSESLTETTTTTTAASRTESETTAETTSQTEETPAQTSESKTEKQTETTSETTTAKKAETTTSKTTAATSPKPANVSVIAASSLATMSTNQIKSIIGNNYKAVQRNDAPNGVTSLGITSDYFPNVLLCYNGINSASGVKSAFDAGNDFVSVSVFQGGYLGENARVGETFSQLIIKIQCLGAAQSSSNTGYTRSNALIDDCMATLFFDHPGELYSLNRRYGTNLVDGCQTNTKCVAASMLRQSRGSPAIGRAAYVTTDRAPLMIAPYDDASHMWAMGSGTKILVNGSFSVNGVKWYYVTDFRTSKGTRKFGYVKASEIRT